MPIYEYRCTNCGHQMEALQKFSDSPLTVCPECGKEALNKLISAAGFQLKGTGWYVTDYKKQPAAAANKEETKTTPAASSTENSTKKDSGSNNSEAK